MTPKNNVKRPKVSDDWFLVWRRQESGRRSQSGELRAAACCVAQHIAGDSHERLDRCPAACCFVLVGGSSWVGGSEECGRRHAIEQCATINAAAPCFPSW